MSASTSENISALDIWNKFQSSVQSVRDDIEAISKSGDISDDSAKLSKMIEGVKEKASTIQGYITSSISYMPAYDVRRTQEIIDKLHGEIKTVELAFKPKKKFTFSSRSKTSEGKSTEISKQTSASADKEVLSITNDKRSIAAQDTVIIQDRIGGPAIMLSEKDFSKSESNIGGQQLLITKCQDITLSAPCLLGTVRLEFLTNCKIFLGPCATSAYMESCKDCLIFTSSHQLRIHESNACQLYVRVNSHPIIEDCTMMGFAPYSIQYENIATDFSAAGLGDAKSWDNVVDFRWHKKTQSPNWSIIPLEQRITSVPIELEHADWKFAFESSVASLGKDIPKSQPSDEDEI